MINCCYTLNQSVMYICTQRECTVRRREVYNLFAVRFRATQFALSSRSTFFRLFPEEIQKVSYHDLTRSNGDSPDPEWFGLKYQNRDVLVTSTLGHCGGLLRSREGTE